MDVRGQGYAAGYSEGRPDGAAAGQVQLELSRPGWAVLGRAVLGGKRHLRWISAVSDHCQLRLRTQQLLKAFISFPVDQYLHHLEGGKTKTSLKNKVKKLTTKEYQI